MCASSVTQAVEDIYYHERPTLVMVMTYMDRFYTVVFVLEMLLKWVAFGYKKYFTDSWCWLDFVIVTVCMATSSIDIYSVLHHFVTVYMYMRMLLGNLLLWTYCWKITLCKNCDLAFDIYILA